MNRAVKSVVTNLSTHSDDYAIVQNICYNAVDENVTNSKNGKWQEYQKVLIKVGLGVIIMERKKKWSNRM